MKKIIIPTLSLVAISMMAGCGGGGGGSASSESLNGSAVDGYLYNAKVCYKNSDVCALTDENGKFVLPRKNDILVLESNESTINTATTATYTSTLLAPAGYKVITPLTTLLASNGDDKASLAKIINMSEENISNFINNDPISLMNSEDNESKIVGAKLYSNGVLVEKLLDTLMLDSNSSDFNKKESLSKVLINFAIDNNKTLSELTTTDFQNIYAGFKSLVGEPLNTINQSKIATIASNLVKLADNNFTDDTAEKFEKQLSGIDIKALLNLSEENISTKMASEVLNIDTITDNSDTSSLSAVAAQKVASSINVNKAPKVILGKQVVIKEVDQDTGDYYFNIDDFNFDDENVSSVTYSIQLSDTSFIDFNNTQTFGLSDKNITLKVDMSKFSASEPVKSVKLSITPKDQENVVGQTKDIFILVKATSYINNSNQKLLNKAINDSNLNTTINLKADDNTGKLSDDNTSVDYSVSDINTSILFADSNDTLVATVDYNKTDLKANAVYNGDANITFVTLNTNTWDVKVNSFDVNISGINLPPVLTINDTYKEVVVSPQKDANVTFSYSIVDPDNADTNFNINIISKPNDWTCITSNDTDNTLKEGNITCTIPSNTNIGRYSLKVDVNDTKLSSSSIMLTTNVLQGNVAPTLSVFAPSNLDIDTMTSSNYTFVANDLNGEDTFDVNATSSDESIVKVVVDKNNSTLTLLAQPKVGSATVTVWAEDEDGLKSKEYNITVTTHNKLAELMPTLYLVPAPFDNRYKMINFSASYDITNNEILINGEINATDDNISLDNFALQSYPDDALFAGSADYNSTYRYGFVFSNGFNYAGQFEKGRVLVFDNNLTNQPYYWALATQDEICKAYEGNTSMIDLINSVNNNEDINCSK